MSGQSLTMFVFMVAIAFAANRAEDVGSSSKDAFTPEATRGLASVPSTTKKLVFAEESPIKHTSKVRGPLDVAIELVGARPNNAGDVFVLRGVITSNEAVNNIEFGWRIPAEVEVVNGELKSVIPNLLPDQPYTVQLTLKQKSFENGKIHFRARGSDKGLRFGDIAQYNSMMQEALDVSRAELKKSTEEDYAAQKAAGTAPQKKNRQFTEEHQHSEFKVFH